MSHKTWEAGPAKTPQKLKRSAENMARSIDNSLAQAAPEWAARRRRGVERTLDLIRANPTEIPCTFFNQTVGTAGGDELEALSIALDGVSASIMAGSFPRCSAPEMVVRAAEATGVIDKDTIGTRTDIDPGLDAMLALYARLDRDWAVEVHRNGDTVSSVFGLLVDMPGHPRRRRAPHRLLDIYFAFATVASTRELPRNAPSIEQLEDALIGAVPESGGQSPIVRWRNGTQYLRREQVEAMSARIQDVWGQDYGRYFRLLWSAAELWDLIELGGQIATRQAGARYAQWWEAMHSPSRDPAPLTHPYWTQFRPHA